MTADYLTEGWPLSPTSTIYMDGTTVYGVRRYGIPGVTNVVLRREHADLIREVVAERIQQAKAEALRDAADEIEAEYDRRGVVAVDAQYQYNSGVLDGLDIAERVVRARADEIAGDDS